MECLSCGHDNYDSASFCGNCGIEMAIATTVRDRARQAERLASAPVTGEDEPLVCSCGTTRHDTALFCRSCGVRFGDEVTNRLRDDDPIDVGTATVVASNEDDDGPVTRDLSASDIAQDPRDLAMLAFVLSALALAAAIVLFVFAPRGDENSEPMAPQGCSVIETGSAGGAVADAGCDRGVA